MRVTAFAGRNLKELLSDPLSLIFGAGLPLFMLILLSVLNKAITGTPGATAMFEIKTLAPGIAMFSLTFIALFVGQLIAQDRTTAFLTRLYNSPMTGADFILGYMLPVLPLTVIQTVICLAAAMLFGLAPGMNMLWTVLVMIPSGVFYTALGVLLGSLFSDKAVGGVCSLLVNLATISAGIWFPLELMSGSTFYKICVNLPFYHTARVGVLALNGETAGLGRSLIWVTGSALIMTVLAVIVFRRKMTADNA